MQISYDDATESEDGPVDTVVDAGDLGVLIGLAQFAIATKGRTDRERAKLQ